jgi:heme/copper-type cytochrome/quinol oxidase subunit 3
VSRLAPAARTQEETSAAVGLLLFLGSSALLFLALWAAALLLSLRGAPPPTPPGWWSLLTTGLLFGVTFQLQKFERTSRRIGARACALLFLGALGLIWKRASLLESSGESSAMALFFILTGIHALHGAAGLLALFAFRRTSRLLNTYWQFLVGAWILTVSSAYLPWP